MNLSAPFVARPVATTLLAIGLVLAGAVAFTQLPVSPLPQVDYPTISVQAQLPGASPDTMASTGAWPKVSWILSTKRVKMSAADQISRCTCSSRPSSMCIRTSGQSAAACSRHMASSGGYNHQPARIKCRRRG